MDVQKIDYSNTCMLIGDIWLIDSMEIRQNLFSVFPNKTALVLGNIETPIVGLSGLSRSKAGPVLSGNLKSLDVLSSIATQNVFSIANNHMMDYGVNGLNATIKECTQRGFNCIGAGNNLGQAKTPAIIQIGDLRVGIVARCETQFGIATSRRSGVAPIDTSLYAEIARLSKEVDVIICSIHFGAEMCPWPSPKRQDIFRSLIDAGAFIVHGHHSHVPQGYEFYNGGIITYGMGNFVVDPNDWDGVDNSLWSLIMSVDLENRVPEQCLLLTSVIEPNINSVCVRHSTEDEFKSHSDYLLKCNKPLSDHFLLDQLWQEASIRMFKLWYAKELGLQDHSSIQERVIAAIRQMLRKIRGSKSDMNRNSLLLYHYFACESHQEAISTALGVLSGEIDDLRTEETRLMVDEMMPWSVGVRSE